MSDISNVTSTIMEELLKQSLTKESTTEKLQQAVNKSNSSKKKVLGLDEETLKKLRDSEFGINLKEYSNLTTYNNLMSTIYGNSSANPFNNYMNKFFGYNTENGLVTAKTFMDTLQEKGISNKSAIKIYGALQQYSLVDVLQNQNNYSFVSAKI